MAEQRRGHLGIEDRPGQVAAQVIEDLHVLTTGVHDLGDGRRIEQGEERPEVVDGQRIDTPGRVRIGDLDQAQARVVGLLAQEFRVDGQPFRLGETAAGLAEGLGRLDHARGWRARLGGRQGRGGSSVVGAGRACPSAGGGSPSGWPWPSMIRSIACSRAMTWGSLGSSLACACSWACRRLSRG